VVPLLLPDLAFEPDEVELSAVPAPANPKPSYPANMIRRRVEARFAVYFVVDTSGHVEGSTVELPLISHEEFARAVLEVLSKWRFVPALIAGRPVRERVKQPFQFRIK
jgi:TonB family protein